ncbi:GNAT family N-acetyltransferase [Massilia sp. Root351]|jgi:RimJ/RimL family protein N-acetyltransferase|uniref:GNAT family N-acetyltransferase n=1 Tax=Massilia sp. Root351 TaxID=1736522 RepID=UPI0009EA5232|nr:GNAT family N-acetyltransferase [Massilia sp. Root351]
MLAIRPIQLSTFEHDSRRQLARSVLAALRTSAPHAVAGLAPAELDFRLASAVSKIAVHELHARDDAETFVRLSLTVGPLFDEYPPFKEILTSYDRDVRILALFTHAAPGDWDNAAQFDIVSRYRKSTPGSSAISLIPLEDRHADAYFRDALHPDVWRLARMTPMTSAADALELIGNCEPGVKTGYAVVNRQGQFLGAAFATRIETATRVSYWIARRAWGQGIASQALMQLKSAMKTEKLVLTIEPGNMPSLKVAAKCGFHQTGAITFGA